MHFSFSPKQIIRIASIFLLTATLLLIIVFLITNHHHQKEISYTEKVKLHELFKKLDSTYWEHARNNLIIINNAIITAKQIGDSSLLAEAMFNKGKILQVMDKNDSAFIIYGRALAIAEKIPNDTLVARVKNGMANYYWKKGNYYEAMSFYTDALKISERIGDKKYVGAINGLGLIYVSLKDYDKAIVYFKKALINLKGQNELNKEGSINMNIGNCYKEKKDYKKAFYYHQIALKIFRSVNDSVETTRALINLSTDKRNLGNTKEALDHLNDATEYLKYLRNKELLCAVLQSFAIISYEGNDYIKARDYIKQNLSIAQSVNSKRDEEETYFILFKIEEKLKNWEASLKYYKNYVNIRDSIMNGDTRKKIAEIKWKYDFQKKEYEAQLFQKKYEIKKRQMLSLFILLILFTIIVLMIGKNMKKSAKLRKLENVHLQEKIKTDKKVSMLEKLRHHAEIEAKNKEVTTTSLQLIAKNEILSEISELVTRFRNHEMVDGEIYKDLTKILKQNYNQEEDWKQFKGIFEKVHQEFFIKLKQICPELSESELRLCAYLRINLQNKEIAKMLNITPETIKKSRYRIRKKLNLDNKKNLDDFIRNI